MECKHLLIPRNTKVKVCFAYVEAYGRAWCPECKDENCPLKHPELLKKEVKSK